MARPWARQWPSFTKMPLARQRSTNSRQSRLFPTPASPTIPTICPCPSRALRSALWSTAISPSRPTNRENPRAREHPIDELGRVPGEQRLPSIGHLLHPRGETDCVALRRVVHPEIIADLP